VMIKSAPVAASLARVAPETCNAKLSKT
jgi:hypothetical protein